MERERGKEREGARTNEPIKTAFIHLKQKRAYLSRAQRETGWWRRRLSVDDGGRELDRTVPPVDGCGWGIINGNHVHIYIIHIYLRCWRGWWLLFGF